MYKKIEDYGIIGDLQTAALVGLDGSVDWFCYPYIDSPSVFGALLDAEKGGCFAVRPAKPYDAVAFYLEETNILVTRFRTRTGILQLTDFMPVSYREESTDEQGAASRVLYRRLELKTGRMRVEVLFEPRYGYGALDTRLTPAHGGVLATAGDWSMGLTSTRSLNPEEVSDSVRVFWDLEARDRVWLRLGSTDTRRCSDRDTSPLDPDRAEADLEATAGYWRSWLHQSETGRKVEPGPYRAMLHRSALLLKLLYYDPTGTIAAAPTTSLPEVIGGSRNWDYRYTWVRDTAFTLRALFELGHMSETQGYLSWLESVISGRGADQLQVLYGLRGETDLPERELDHLDGYKGSRPVRVGNRAAGQFQLDIYGELLDAGMRLSDYVGQIDHDLWPMLQGICDHVVKVWREPDHGIWEVRGGPYQFVHSKVMCWVALDRGVAIAERYGFPGDLEGWRRAMGEIREEVLDRGFCEEKQAFVQHYDTTDLDATGLLIPILGFLPADDPRAVGTVDAIQKELGRDGFVYRYLGDDGLDGREGTFLLCTFWLIDCLVELGRLDEAESLLRGVERAANHLGLFAEEYCPIWQEALGNFPQAFTHIGYIDSVVRLVRAREGRQEEPEPDLRDEALAFVRKKLLFRKAVLNEGAPNEEVPEEELAHRLKATMNRLRGAFFNTPEGRVQYEWMKRSDLYETYRDLSRNLQRFNPHRLETQEEKTAFWINLYNVIVIHGVIELGIRDSVKEVRGFFQRIVYGIGGHEFTPDDIEHGILRGNRRPPHALTRRFGRDDPRLAFSLPEVDPRIHFALVCASFSCPPIEVYTAEELDRQLTESGRTFLNGGGIDIDREAGIIRLSKVFQWYKDDFGGDKKERLRFIASLLYREEDRDFLLEHGHRCRIEYMAYDWHLNRTTGNGVRS
jgi:GH15 family glucan-1,4-alpha-glucosidase